MASMECQIWASQLPDSMANRTGVFPGQTPGRYPVDSSRSSGSSILRSGLPPHFKVLGLVGLAVEAQILRDRHHSD